MMRRCISPLPPGPIFRGRHLHSRNNVGAKKELALERSRRELSEDVGCVVQFWHPLGYRAIELGKSAPKGCDVHTPSYTMVWPVPELRHGRRGITGLLDLSQGRTCLKTEWV